MTTPTTEVQALRAEVTALTQTVSKQFSLLTETVQLMARIKGDRLTSAQVVERVGRTRQTITTMVRRGDFPEPCADGRWLLADIMEWEAKKK